MNQEITNKLIELADKLGTTTEYLWSVLVKQAGITAIINIFAITVIALAAIMFCKLLLSLKKKKSIEDEAVILLGFIGGLLTVFVIAGITCDAITCLLNPEYWALKEILKALK